MESETPTHTIHVWYVSCICPYISRICMVNVGKYIPFMDAMGYKTGSCIASPV